MKVLRYTIYIIWNLFESKTVDEAFYCNQNFLSHLKINFFSRDSLLKILIVFQETKESFSRTKKDLFVVFM